MIKSCQDCKTKCCSAGPGPYEWVTPQQFLLNYGENDNYNKMCVAYIDGKCAHWGTNMVPLECKIYVCQNREFSKEELTKIAALTGR